MAQYYSFQKHGKPSFNPGSNVKKDIKKGKTVMGRAGGSAPKGYYMAGTTTRTNKAGDTTYNIYKKLPTQKSAPAKPVKQSEPRPASNNNNQQSQAQPQQPQNNFQSQIDSLMATISSQQAAAQEAAAAAQAAADARMAEMSKAFESQMAAAAQQQQQQLDAMMLANQQAMDRMQAEQAERARQMQIAQQTQAANAARAGQTADFQVGGQRGIGGIGQFKRRLDIKPVTADALSIAGGAKGANKMLNV